jgi:hypothetical protein
VVKHGLPRLPCRDQESCSKLKINFLLTEEETINKH